MKKYFIFAVAVFFLSGSSFAIAREVGEAYAKPSTKDLYQTLVLLGAFDIHRPEVADEYARLIRCDLYKAHQQNDFEWDKIQKNIVSNVVEKKDSYRVLYEIQGVFQLGRYNFDLSTFDLAPKAKMLNVGMIKLQTKNEMTPYCDVKYDEFFFPTEISLHLGQPITFTQLHYPPDRAEALIARMNELQIPERQVYGRLRFHVTDAPTVDLRGDKIFSAALRGELSELDLFLDKEMTRWIGSVEVPPK